MKKSLDERLSLLEYRMALLEGKKDSPTSKPAEKVLAKLGVAYILEHMNTAIMHDPQYSNYDEYLREIFNCEITQKNRVEYADKARKLSLSILEEAVEECKNIKK